MFEDRLIFMKKFIIFLIVITILMVLLTYPITIIGILGLLTIYFSFKLPIMIINILYNLTKNDEILVNQEEIILYQIRFSYGGIERYEKVEYQTEDKKEFIYKVLELQESDFFKNERNCSKDLIASINHYKTTLIRVNLLKYIEEYELVEAIKRAEIALGKKDIKDKIIENSKKIKNLVVRKEELGKLETLDNQINYENNSPKDISFSSVFDREKTTIYFIMFEDEKIGYFITEEKKINNIHHLVIVNLRILHKYNKTEYLFALKLYIDFGVPVSIRFDKKFNQVLIKKFDTINTVIKRSDEKELIEYEWYPYCDWWH